MRRVVGYDESSHHASTSGVRGGPRDQPRSRTQLLLRRLLPQPPRQRPPLLPILLAARARKVEHARSIARTVHISLRIAKMRDDRKWRSFQERIQLGGALGA